MLIIKVDPRALAESPDTTRRPKSSPQADALLPATIKAVGIIQPPVVAPWPDGGNGYVVDAEDGFRLGRRTCVASLQSTWPAES